MKTTLLVPAFAAIAAMTAIPMFAAAQDYEPGQAEQQQQQQQSYGQQQSYEQQQQSYQQRLSDYNDQRDGYERDQQTWQQNDRRGYDNRRYDRRYYAQRGYDASCADQRVSGGVIGALAGAAIGSNLAERGSRSEGAVLGAFAGGAIGAGIASSARCDGRGYYYSYNQTSPYREPARYDGQRSGQFGYAYYARSHCRLVVAPTQWGGRDDARYVRVCPDDSGRYRLTR